MSKRLLKIIIILVLVSGSFYAFTKNKPDSTSDGRAQNTSLSFDATTLKGQPFSLEAYKGKIIILDFWATWCPPCVVEIPHFIALQNAYPDQVQVVGVSLDQTPEPVGEFIKANGINYPIVMGTEAIVDQFGPISGIPTTFILDRNLNRIDKAVGYRDQAYFESIIKDLLNLTQ